MSLYNIRNERISPDQTIKLIVRNARLRFSCYWLEVINLSESGIAIKYEGKGILPLKHNDEIDITLDVNSKIFERPILIRGKIVHEEFSKGEDPGSESVLLGIDITEIEPRHEKHWKHGIQKLLKH